VLFIVLIFKVFLSFVAFFILIAGGDMLKKILLVLLVSVFVSSAAMAEKTITVAVPATVPPMAFVDDQGQLAGYSVDYINDVAKAAGFTVVLKNIPWSGIFAGLARGDFDAICAAVSITEDRAKVVDFTVPYFEVRHALVVPVSSDVKSLSDLAGKKVGGKSGSIAYQALTKVSAIEAVGYDEVSVLLKAIKAVEIDGAVYDEPMVAHYIKTQYSDTLKIASFIESKKKDSYGIAVKKDNSEVLDMLNKGMKAIKGSSREKELQKKWLSTK